MGALRPTLGTDRLSLRRPRLTDARAIFERYAQDPEVTRFVLWEPHRSVEVTEDFLKACIDAWDLGIGHRAWVIERADDARPIGMIGVTIQARRAEVGYVLARDCWGNGYMTEALQAVIACCFESDALDRVWAVADVDNAASTRVMERAGMQYEGVLRAWARRPSIEGPRDCSCYAAVRYSGSGDDDDGDGVGSGGVGSGSIVGSSSR